MATKKAKTVVFGLEENAGGAVAYIFGWVTGLVFLLMEKENKFVRFHAMQSLIFFAGLQIMLMTPLVVFLPLMAPLAFVVWLVCIFKAYNGEEFELPVVGQFARKQLKKL